MTIESLDSGVFSSNNFCFVSEAKGEQVVKLLQLIAGDVETNPGPMAVSFSFHQPSTSIMSFQDQLPDVGVPVTTKRKNKNESCSNCDFLRCKILVQTL